MASRAGLARMASRSPQIFDDFSLNTAQQLQSYFFPQAALTRLISRYPESFIPTSSQHDRPVMLPTSMSRRVPIRAGSTSTNRVMFPTTSMNRLPRQIHQVILPTTSMSYQPPTRTEFISTDRPVLPTTNVTYQSPVGTGFISTIQDASQALGMNLVQIGRALTPNLF